MRIHSIASLSLGLLLLALLPACKTTTTKTSATSFRSGGQPAQIESVEIETTYFYGKPDVTAIVKGRLTSNAAQLAEVEQYRPDPATIEVRIPEVTPVGAVASNRIALPPFQTRVVLETTGLIPGQNYRVLINGYVSIFEMPEEKVIQPKPAIQATLAPPEPVIEMNDARSLYPQ